MMQFKYLSVLIYGAMILNYVSLMLFHAWSTTNLMWSTTVFCIHVQVVMGRIMVGTITFV